MMRLPYHQYVGEVRPRHKWQDCINAYSRGQRVQWRLPTGPDGGVRTSAWHDLTSEMVEGRAEYATMRTTHGEVWDWDWLEFRLHADDAYPYGLTKLDGKTELSCNFPIEEVECRML